MENPTPLSPAQSAALFDILSHDNTYAEIQDFRNPGTLDSYGPPFTNKENTPSTSPSLQALISKFVTILPGIRDVPDDFWKVHIKSIVEQLQLANLSESYDKGSVGTRKTLATAISALIEYPIRGTMGGFPNLENESQEYDLTNADDLARAFQSQMNGIIYGNASEELVARTALSDDLSTQPPIVQALHEFILVNMASLLHYTIVLSPKGQYMVSLMANVHKLTPYTLIRQTFKIGNVATMINAMMKIILAKISVTSVTNWVGLTRNDNDGMNLLQTILSQTLSWDNKEFRSKVSKIEKDKNRPSQDQLRALKDYAIMSQDKQEKIRNRSKRSSSSIVKCIFASASLPTDMYDTTHTLALDYLSATLSIRDREEIIRVLCHSTPDHLTVGIRLFVAAYDSVIRNFHNAVDLSDTISDMEAFISDFIKLAKIQPATKDRQEVVPTVGDFAQLLKKHSYASHKFLHQMCKNGPELMGWYLEYGKEAAAQFRQDSNVGDDLSKLAGAGKLDPALQSMFTNLPPNQQVEILPILNMHSKHLDELNASSQSRLQEVLKSAPSDNPALIKIMKDSGPSSSRGQSPSPSLSSENSLPGTEQGPGAYLERWEDLLAKTPLTPQSLQGGTEKQVSKLGVQGPDTTLVIEAMGQDFRDLLGSRSVYW